MEVFAGGMLSGAGLALLVTSLLIDNKDENYQHMQNKMQTITEICESANSTPKSFDKYTVTCENGGVFDYKVGE